MIERVLTVDDVSSWQDVLSANVNVFGSVEYARIQNQFFSYVSRLFLVESGQSRIVYPFFIRSINTLPFVGAGTPVIWDSFTPEYTGPFWVGPSNPKLAAFFHKGYADYFLGSGIVAEFAHLHPWLQDSSLVDAECTYLDREIVFVDLTLTPEQMWRDSFTQACRKNINRSAKENVKIFVGETTAHIEEFYRIYTRTMKRNNASEHYYFPIEYFMAFLTSMPDHARYVLAEYKDQIIAATLYLHDDTNVYSYLGGADEAFQQIRPTNAIVYSTILWSQQTGKKRLILGGGYRPDDGIFKFKLSFSPLRKHFYIYKRVHMQDTFSTLQNAWSNYYHTSLPESGYFPPYRLQPVSLENIDKDNSEAVPSHD
jgi:serine/alanine adding enzyme